MDDLGKVKAGLKACKEWGMDMDECFRAGCPYFVEGTMEDDGLGCVGKLHADVLAMIQETEAEEDDRK